MPMPPLFRMALRLACLGFLLPTTAQAQNLVQDGDFELANPGVTTFNTSYFGPTGQAPMFDAFWTVPAGTVAIDTARDYVYAGNKSLWLNSDDPMTSPTNTLSQTLLTTPGQSYLLTFYADSSFTPNALGSGPHPLTVTFDGNIVSGSAIDVPENGYPNSGPGSNAALFTLYSFLVTTNSSLTDLTFSAQGSVLFNPGNTLELDNISVTPAAVPEPGSIALFVGMGITGTVFLRRHKRSV